MKQWLPCSIPHWALILPFWGGSLARQRACDFCPWWLIVPQQLIWSLLDWYQDEDVHWCSAGFSGLIPLRCDAAMASLKVMATSLKYWVFCSICDPYHLCHSWSAVCGWALWCSLQCPSCPCRAHSASFDICPGHSQVAATYQSSG